MRLTSTGLGIGTSSPSSFSGYTTVSVNNATNGGIYNILVNDTETARLQAFSGIFNVAAKGAATNLTFETNGAERMRLDASGNLGLGVTPSAWDTARKAFQISSTGALVSSSLNTLLGDNWYVDASANKYLSTGAATIYQQTSGSHRWYNAPSGTAGNAITFTQAMTLDASGNLLLGTTTSAYATSGRVLVEVNGSSTALIALKTSDTARGYFAASTSITELAAVGASQPLVFTVNAAERARIDSSGRLIVGSTTSNGDGSVEGVARSNSTPGVVAGSRTSGDVGSAALLVTKFDNDSTTSQVFQRFSINNNGTASGQINANGANAVAFGSWSDARLKENIVNLPPQLANVMALRPVEFDYIESEGGGHQTGFIAQELQAVYPDAIGERQDGMLTVTGWSKTEARLVKAIQEQQAIIEQLKADVAALKGA
jgi:hypothetical protein